MFKEFCTVINHAFKAWFHHKVGCIDIIIVGTLNRITSITNNRAFETLEKAQRHADTVDIEIDKFNDLADKFMIKYNISD